MTKWVKREVVRVGQWKELDEVYAVGEFRVQLLGWEKGRRFAVVREKKREEKRSVSRSLFELPEYTFRVFVTNLELPPEEVWREYNQRANMENRIAELKYDLGADDFCMHKFFATEAAFRGVSLLFNLLCEFQRATGTGWRTTSGQPCYVQPFFFVERSWEKLGAGLCCFFPKAGEG